MNNKIRNIDLESLLFFDIETIRGTDDLDTESDMYKVFRYKNRNKEDQSLLPEEDVLKLWKDKAALSPVYGKIICISVGFVKAGTVYFKSFTGDEKTILESFFDIWDKKPVLIPCGYNIIKFDIPYCRIRATVNGLQFPNKFNDSGQKPWTLADNIVDIMEAVTGCFINSFSLEELCLMLGVKSPKGSIDGSKVSDVFYKEGVSNIATYCEGDVIAVIECFNKLSEKNIDLKYQAKVDDSGPIYDKIKKAKKLTPKLTKDLMEFKDKYESRPKDFEKIREILVASSTIDEVRSFIRSF